MSFKGTLRPKSHCDNETPRAKLVMIGDSGVGKSCLLERFVDKASTNNWISTIGVDIRTIYLDINGKNTRIQVWDTGGQQRYRPVLASCYKGALGVVVVFDLTNRTSFSNVAQWLHEVDEFSALDADKKILVGNKADLQADRKVDQGEATQFAEQLRMKYIETSVLDQSNIQEAFTRLVEG
jgi:Ras-related protein Rab-1A